jgi:nickel-dependent lactate racemase
VSESEARKLAAQALNKVGVRGRKVLIIIPDSTRTAPIPMFFRLFHDLIGGEAKNLDYLIALGTHPPMPDDKINALLGITADERKTKYAKVRVFNHRWDLPQTLKKIGTIPADEIHHITKGLMKEDVPVALNKIIFDYDLIIICGPTFPHEVVGFSGGNKYLFPGIAGADIINFFHWLGAVITNPVINGTKNTPVRAVVDRAAALLQMERLCFSLVVTYGGLNGLYIGRPEDAFSAAADLSARLHIIYKEKPYRRILSMSPKMYDDIWTAGKCMYKMEPVVADGGELIIYAPHIDEVSYTHGKIIDKIGYHTRDYFMKQMHKFKGIPGGVMAHSTHVKGIGTFENGVEEPRVNVILATKISPDRCKRINLGYMDPVRINPKDFEGRESEGILCVPKAGEMLYRLNNPPAWQVWKE